MKFPASIFALLFLALVPYSTAGDAEKSTAKTQQVVVHLSHFTNDLHRCFMALKMANLMQDHGAEVTIFLDLEGVRLAERRQSLDLTWGTDSPTLAQHYDNFTQGGGKVVLCPHCAKSARIGDGALKRNAEIATMPSLGKLLMAADKVMDY
ncbi:MAG: DsrE family protein [Pirellulales bacterium]|nr:DsrE family protein [Pirellulales bacterium]